MGKKHVPSFADTLSAGMPVLNAPRPARPTPRADSEAAPATAPAPTSSTSSTTPAEQPTRTPAPQRKQKAQEQTPAPASEVATGDSKTPSVQISLPRSLHERMIATKTKLRVSIPHLVMDAIEATYADLPELLKAELPSRPQVTGTSLFERPATSLPPTVAEPKETTVFRLSRRNRDVINQLTADLGAPSRNALLTVAVQAYLDRISTN